MDINALEKEVKILLSEMRIYLLSLHLPMCSSSPLLSLVIPFELLLCVQGVHHHKAALQGLCSAKKKKKKKKEKKRNSKYKYSRFHKQDL